MNAVFRNAWPYIDDALDLPVESVETALPYYKQIMGFTIVSRAVSPHASVVLERDDVKIGLAENGRDPSQDGCAFEVDNVEAALAEFNARGSKNS